MAETEVERAQRIAVLGLGRGGSRVVSCLASMPLAEGLDLAAADTDLASLEAIDGVVQIPLGRDWTRHSGCGGDVGQGERAAGTAATELRQFVSGADLLLVVAGLGGGTGSGAAKAVARWVRDLDVTALFVLTLPFAFEGVWRRQQADGTLEALRSLVDIPVVVPNDLFFRNLSADTPTAEAFALVDRVLAEGVLGLSRLTSATPLLQVDLASLRVLLRHPRAVCSLASGRGSGEDRVQRALDSFFACPFLGGRDSLASADGALVILTGDAGFTVGEIQICSGEITPCFPTNARVLVGAYVDPHSTGEVRITGVVCNYGSPTVGERPPSSGRRDSGRKRKSAARISPAAAAQGILPLQEVALGCFSGTPPTMYGGENLDIPTFQRRAVALDVGD